MPNPLDILSRIFKAKNNFERLIESEGEEQPVAIHTQEHAAAEPTAAVAIHMQEEEPVAEVASPEKITELLNIVQNYNKNLKKGGFEAELNGEVVASAKLVELKDGLHQLIQLNVIAEVTFELKAAYESEYASFNASLQAFAKASLDFSVDFMNIEKGEFINANFDFNAKVAAIATASAEVRIFKIGDLGGTVGVYAEAYAIAEASVSGTFRIGQEGISMKANVKLGATAGVSFEGSATVAFKGTTLIKVSQKIDASVGAGSEIGGTFSFENGILKINMDLGLTVGVGGAVHENIEINFAAIKECIQVELEVLGVELKAKINAYLIEKKDEIIAALVEAGDDTESLLKGNIDSETGILHETSTWAEIKGIVNAKQGLRNQKALLMAIELGIRFTNGNGGGGNE